MNQFEMIPLANKHCATGENPFWNPDDQRIYWSDIPNGKLYRYTPATKFTETIYEGEQVGGFTLQANGDLLLFRVTDLSILDVKTLKVRTVRQFTDQGMNRFNDVSADPEGRVYAGTMGNDLKGGLYRFDPDGSVTKMFEGTNCSNGMGWTPDLKTMFWTDSTAKIIYRFAYDRATGALSNREVFYKAQPEEGTPDGMAVDGNGEVWSARWNGHAIIHHAADGKVIEKIPFPVARVSSLCFGGEDGKTAFVTTAGGSEHPEGEDGTLYQVRMPVAGILDFRSRIPVD